MGWSGTPFLFQINQFITAVYLCYVLMSQLKNQANRIMLDTPYHNVFGTRLASLKYAHLCFIYNLKVMPYLFHLICSTVETTFMVILRYFVQYLMTADTFVSKLINFGATCDEMGNALNMWWAMPYDWGIYLVSLFNNVQFMPTYMLTSSMLRLGH